MTYEGIDRSGCRSDLANEDAGTHGTEGTEENRTIEVPRDKGEGLSSELAGEFWRRLEQFSEVQ